MNSHIVGLDIARFAAAAIVCAFHLTYWGNVSTGTTADALQGAAWFPTLGFVTRYGWVGVEIFFVISGFVIAYTTRGKTAFQFFRSRFFRLVPAAWICATITVLFALEDGLFQPTFALRAWLASVLFFPKQPFVDGAYWTLGVEVSFYLLTGLLIATRKFAHFEKMVCLVGIASTLAAVVCIVRPFDLYFSRLFELCLLRHGCCFALGVIGWLIMSDKDTWARRAVALIFFSGCMAEIAITSKGPRGGPLIPVMIFAGSVLVMAASIKWNNKILAVLSEPTRKAISTIGGATYPLYLLHNVVGVLLVRRLVEAGVTDWLALLCSATTVLALSFAVCLEMEPRLRAFIDRLFMQRLGRLAMFRPA